MCASRKRVETLVGGGARHTTNAPFTYNPRRCPPSPFPPPRRSAPSRYVARSRSRRAREAGPSRREKRRRLRCRVFVAPASRRAGRADETTGFRANAVDARRPREGNRSVKRPHPPSWGTGAPPLRPDPRDAGRDPNPLIRVWRSTTVWLRFFLLRRTRARDRTTERRTTNDAHHLPSLLLLLLLLRTGRRAQDLCANARPPLRRGERRFEREGPEAHRDARPRHRG